MKILIFGVPSSGKSTLARRLGTNFIIVDNATEYSSYNSKYDIIFTGVFPTRRSRESFDADIKIFLNTIKDYTEYFEVPSYREYDMIISNFEDISISEILYQIESKKKTL